MRNVDTNGSNEKTEANNNLYRVNDIIITFNICLPGLGIPKALEVG